MQKQYEQSRLGILVGNDFSGEGKTFGKFEIHFFQKKAAEQMEDLNHLTNGQIDLEWSIVCALQALPGQGQSLLDGLVEMYEATKKDGMNNYIFKAVSKDDIVYFSLKQNYEDEQQMMEPFLVFFNQGFEEIAKEQENQISGMLSSDFDPLEFYQGIVQGERIVSMLLKSLKFEMFMKMHSTLANKLRGIIQSLDPQEQEDAPIVILQHFKNFDIDLRFKSTQDLPQTIKNKVIGGKHKGEEAFDVNYPGFQKVIDSIGGLHDIWFTIPDSLAGHLQVKVPNTSKIVIQYGYVLGGLVLDFFSMFGDND